MAETLEAFVAKIQSEGIEAGKKQAESIVSDAQSQADQIVADAQKKAERIVADAEQQANSKLERAQTELKLAARDIVLELRQTLSQAIESVFAKAAEAKLDDENFVGTALHEIVTLYAKREATHHEVVTIDVPADMRQKLVDWALREVGKPEVEGLRPHFDLKGNLQQRGFEYSVDNSTVEVTTEAVVSMLQELVTPQLREILDQAVGETDGQTPEPKS